MKLSLSPLFASVAVLAFAPLFANAQESSPIATPGTAATVAPPPVSAPAKSRKPVPPVAPVVPEAAAPVASPSGTSVKKEPSKESLTLAKASVEEISAAIDYQIAQAKRVELRGKISARSQGEISRSRERATELVMLQVARVEKAGAELQAGKATIDVLVEELSALTRIASEAAVSIAEVRTYDDDTEETLQEISACFDEIAEKAHGFIGDITEDAARNGTALDISVDENGGVRFRAGNGDDRVFYGSPVEIKEGETVNDAVSIGESVTVHGHVLGSAVALGGNVLVGKTGRIDGDASAVGGRITVEEGGRIDGEQVSLGPGAATALLTQFAAPPPAAPLPLGARIGMSLLTAGAEFLCFFLLGLLTITVIPRRVDLVADGLTGHPVKSGAFGMLASFLFIPLTILLCVIVIGIPFVPILWFGYFLCGFVGTVALALVIGRRFPAKEPLTSTGTLAVGAGLLVAVGLIPILGWLVWIVAAIVALGAALHTRFGQDRDGGTNNTDAAVPGSGTGLSSIA